MRWTWLVFWAVAGVAMLLSSFVVNWFEIDFTFFKLNLGFFALVYAGLLALRNVLMKQQIEMTGRELHDWGDKLAQATPNIIELAGNGSRPKEIAALLKADRGIPELVSLKYMVALSKEMKRDAKKKG